MAGDGHILPTLPSKFGPLPVEALASRALRLVNVRRWWFLVTVLLVFAAAVVMVKRQKPVFRATGTMTVDQAAPRVMSTDSDVAPLSSQGGKPYYQAQRQILQSRDLAAIVVNRLGLARDERFLGIANPELRLTRAQKDSVIATADVVGMMASRVLTESPDESGIVKVSIEDTDPDMAKDLVNAVLKAYRDRNIDVKKRVVKEASSDLNAIFKRLEAEKSDSQKNLYIYDRDHDFSDTRRSVVADRIMALNRAMRDAHTVKQRAMQEVSQLRKYKGSRDVFSAAAPALMRDGLLIELKRRFLELSTRRKELATTYLQDHPKIVVVDQQLDQLLGLAGRHVTALHDSAQQQVVAATNEEKDVTTQLALAKDEDSEIRKAKIEHDKLSANADEDRLFYDKVAKRLTETDILRDIGVNNINILDLAVTPKSPVRPNVQVAMSVGLLLALLAGILVAVGVDLLDNTLKTREDIELTLGVPFLGAIPRFLPGDLAEGLPVPVDRIDLYVHYRPNSRVAEAARGVRTNLLFMRPDAPLKALLITSAAPREGKTSTSATLAITLAASTGKALLVDTDLRKPRLHKLFGLPGGEGGLTSHVLTNQPIENFVRRTDVPGLDLLPCGPLPPNPAEIVHTQRFRDMVKRLTELYEVVIFDSSPIELVTEPLVMASLMDGVVLVAHAEATRVDSAKQCVSALQAINANILGVVLSRTRRKSAGYGYYYANGYRRGGQYKYRYQYRYQRDPDADGPPGGDDARG